MSGTNSWDHMNPWRSIWDAWLYLRRKLGGGKNGHEINLAEKIKENLNRFYNYFKEEKGN